MNARLALLALAPLLAPAELRTFVVAGGLEQPLGAICDVGSVTAGDALEIRLRVRNTGAAAGALQSVGVAGVGFSPGNLPPLPYTLAPGAAVDFTVRFAPAAGGSYSASLAVNGVSTILRGTAVPGAEVRVEDALSSQLLRAGDTVDFGRVERGASATRRFQLLNRTGGWLRITLVRLEGQAFQGPSDPVAPVLLDNGQSVSFDVRFAPSAAGVAEGALEVDGRRFLLRGAGLDIPLPRPLIRIEPEVTASARQATLRIEFAEPARTAGAGELRVEFRSAVAGVAADPAILFLPAASRFAPFTAREGDTRARFGERDEITFQTGTTAGALVFTARLGDAADQAILPIAPAPVEFESLQALRSGSQLELQITGFDNVRTVSQMTFTFYDLRDAPVAPGPLKVDVAGEFRRYFETSAVGGAFALRAVFPVTGKPTDIVAVDVEALNSVGPTRAARLRLP
jgi:hypothetical protein